MPETEILIKIGRRIFARLKPKRTAPLPAAKPLKIFSTAGYQLSCHWLEQNQSAPTLLCCPDFPDTSASFLEDRYPFSCAAVFEAGYNLMIFDPAGRGQSWGTEDHGGLEHQDNVSTLLTWIHKQAPESKIGVLSIGCGLSFFPLFRLLVFVRMVILKLVE